MNRLTMTFIVLTATGGCMAVDRDPIDDYSYGYPRRPSAQSQAWPPPGSTSWNGRPVQAAYTNWGTDTSNSRSNMTSSSSSSTSQSTVAATPKKTTTSSSSTTVAAAKPVSLPRSSASKTTKSEDALVKATYSEAKGSSDSESDSSKTLSAKASSSVAAHPAEPKSPPVNLGVLRLLNSKRITFHYEVKDPAATGVGALEMWGTTDMRSWKKYNVVTRSPSSLVVEVKEEGLYGFSMIARGKNETAKNQPPLPGEAPQVWVCVDLSKPDVQLLGAELNIMAKTPGLVIRWNARDRNFGPRPITLLYAERMEGPWTPIAANVENNGRYEWTMSPCAPSTVFVRVQAVDLMGNVSMAQTTTLHIPGRTVVSAVYSEPKLADPPQLGSTLPPPPPTSAGSESALRPVGLTVPNPAVSILSVDNE
jgi:hypothetical protein